MKRAYKVKTGKAPDKPGHTDTRAFKIMLAENMRELYERILAGHFEEALREEELHIVPLGDVQ